MALLLSIHRVDSGKVASALIRKAVPMERCANREALTAALMDVAWLH